MQSLPLVGRQAELTLLMQEVRRRETRQGSLVLIGAEAGGGKSSLVRALETQSGMPIHIGYCPGPGETAPYGPWLEALRRAAAGQGTPLDDLPPPFGQAGGQWTDRDRASAVAAWLRADGRPCVLALEDLHWADPQSLSLLRHLPHFLRDVPLLVLATYRHDEVHRKHPLWSLLPELQRAGAVRMPLNRLAAGDVAELVTAVWPGHPDGPAIAQRLHERTAGHPFLVHELLLAAARTGTMAAEDEDLPETVEQMIDLKLAALPEEAIALLQGAALLGERFAPALLGQVQDLPEEQTLALLQQAAHQRIVHLASLEEAWFDHSLLRQALIRRLSVLQRRQLHQRIAEVLLSQPHPDPEILARHLSRASDPRAPDYLLRAGDRSVSLGALTQAGERYRRALELVQADHPLRAELLLKLGNTQRLADRELARTCWEEAAQARTDPAVAAWARHFLALWHADKGHPVALAHMQEVMALHMTLLSEAGYQRLEADLFGTVCGYPRIMTNLVQVYAIHNLVRADAELNLVSARQLVEQMRYLATPGSLHPQLLWADIYVTFAEGRSADTCPMWEQLSEQYLQLRDYRQAAAAAFNHVVFLFDALSDQPEMIDRAAARLLHLEKLALERAGIGLVPAGWDSLGYYHVFRGNVAEARRQLVDYFRAHPEDRRFMRRHAAFELQFAQGDYAGAQETLAYMEPLRPDDPPTNNLYFQLFTHACQARLALALGDSATARAWLAAADRCDPSDSATEAPYLAVAWAQYHRHVGDRAAALAAAERAARLTAGGRWRHKQVEAHTILGELLAEQGDIAAAAEHFALAESVAERCRFPYYVSFAQVARVRSFPAAPDAPQSLTAALETLRRLGAAPAVAAAEALMPVVARAAAQMAAAATLPGEGLRPVGTALPAGLSRREAEVAILVARGLTDKEVAAKLFLSRRTVDTHIRHIYGKVGISNRAALGTWVAEQGLQRYLGE